MRDILSQVGFEAVARDAAVKANGVADPRTKNSRLGHGLQRLFEPISKEPLDQVDHLLMLLDRSLSDNRK
jgi:hypothetical protein